MSINTILQVLVAVISFGAAIYMFVDSWRVGRRYGTRFFYTTGLPLGSLCVACGVAYLLLVP